MYHHEDWRLASVRIRTLVSRKISLSPSSKFFVPAYVLLSATILSSQRLAGGTHEPGLGPIPCSRSRSLRPSSPNRTPPPPLATGFVEILQDCVSALRAKVKTKLCNFPQSSTDERDENPLENNRFFCTRVKIKYSNGIRNRYTAIAILRLLLSFTDICIICARAYFNLIFVFFLLFTYKIRFPFPHFSFSGKRFFAYTCYSLAIRFSHAIPCFPRIIFIHSMYAVKRKMRRKNIPRKWYKKHNR